MSLFFQVLASGSKGNALVVASSKTRIMIDAGLTAKELVRRLDKTPVRGADLSAILISHEHQDHVRGAGVMSRRFGLPVHLSRGTQAGLSSYVGQLAQTCLFAPGEPFQVGDLRIYPF